MSGLTCLPTLRSRFSALLRIAIGCTIAITDNASAADVWVITDRQHPVAVPPGARLIELDAPDRIEAELARRLPSDAKKAAALVQQRLADTGEDLIRRLASGYQGVTDAWSLGISKIPAIVVDRRYVVYGELDVRRAVALIKRYRDAHP